MAKKGKKKGSKKAAASAAGKHPIGKHTYRNRKFDCYGKAVRAGKSTTKVPRIFCARDKKAAAK